ncbi:MAG: patatin-like phospholipase family protein [Lysobacterales bacterium]|jgi:predicted acylesterase/phospholipase RssA
MLTIHQALAPSQTRPPTKTGLAIAGGGPVGAIYELGALRALDESVEGLRLHELDVYVGVSAGALIAAGLANRIPMTELCRIFLGHEYASLRFEPGSFLRPAYREYLRRAVSLPAIIRDALLAMLRHPASSSLSQLIGELGKAIPSGLFDNESMHDFLQRAFEATGHSNHFDDLECQLYVVAVDLDTGGAVRFGSPAHRNVSISRAVQASAALPGLYPPVEIGGRFYVDGALRRTLHASVALDEGTDLLFSINPLVPFNAASDGADDKIPTRQLIEGGLPLILSQTFRAMIQSRMEAGFKQYHTSHPFADLVLLEPDRSDETIFFTNIFSYASRKALCEYAYQMTRRDLLARRRTLDRVLGEHGMSLNLERLSDSKRTLLDSIGARGSSHAPVARNLSGTLDELEDALAR